MNEQLKTRIKALHFDLDFEIEENVIQVYGSPYWGADTKEEYEASEALINEYKRSGDGWELYCWCDCSGYAYWMKQQEEGNYLSIDVVLTKEDYTDEELDKIVTAIVFCDQYFEDKLDTVLP